MKTNCIYNHITSKAAAACFLVVAGTVIVMAQQENGKTKQKHSHQKITQSTSESKPATPAMRKVQQNLEIRSETPGLTSRDQDAGYSIVALRRVNYNYKDVLNNVATYFTVPKIRIELYFKQMPEIRNALDYILIGDSAFVGYEKCSLEYGHCIKITMTTDEFDQLRDNSIVSYYQGAPINVEQLKEIYRQGEPSNILGIKFGRINKQLINQFPVIELPVMLTQ